MSAVFERHNASGRRYSSSSGINRELLTSVEDSVGARHARYPTAHRTLCGLLISESPHPTDSAEPTCTECVWTALAMDDVDGSIPDRWRET